MTSKLARIGMVSVMVGLMACASSAFAQATAEGRDSTILVQYASSHDAPGTTANAVSAGTGANNQTSYGSVARPANDQSTMSSQELAADTPAGRLESKVRGDNNSVRGRSLSETPPCLGAGHYYGASVVNSVPSSCFLGNSGPAPLGGLF
jgi:hypothetical protein